MGGDFTFFADENFGGKIPLRIHSSIYVHSSFTQIHTKGVFTTGSPAKWR